MSTTKKCPHCAEEINIEAKKCKHCGEFLEKVVSSNNNGTTVKKVPYWKALLYCISTGFGLMVMSMVILFPLFFLGILLVVASPIMAFFILEGDCPYCSHRVVIVQPRTIVKCRHCKQRSSLQNMRLVPLKVFSAA